MLQIRGYQVPFCKNIKEKAIDRAHRTGKLSKFTTVDQSVQKRDVYTVHPQAIRERVERFRQFVGTSPLQSLSAL